MDAARRAGRPGRLSATRGGPCRPWSPSGPGPAPARPDKTRRRRPRAPARGSRAAMTKVVNPGLTRC
uniref:Predicted protein n=1 Tax=Hordeum vulgare subsp. vulgare TaxID=112509 RepID=F2EDZ8_HORVV|nr:predicted protein [Hordeum vulgare subsp. vulgare]